MNLLLQQVLAGALVMVAIGYVTVHYIRKKKSKSGCAACKALEAVQQKSTGNYKVESAVRRRQLTAHIDE